jgi:hypothetical protein
LGYYASKLKTLILPKCISSVVVVKVEAATVMMVTKTAATVLMKTEDNNYDYGIMISLM